MAFNPFIGWTVPELEKALREAQEELAAGASTTRVGAGDVSTDSQVNKSPEARIEMIYRVLTQLYPDKYPANQTVRVDRTRLRFDRSPYDDWIGTGVI